MVVRTGKRAALGWYYDEPQWSNRVLGRSCVAPSTHTDQRTDSSGRERWARQYQGEDKGEEGNKPAQLPSEAL
eukprot:981466-Amphidinium_carterae.1